MTSSRDISGAAYPVGMCASYGLDPRFDHELYQDAIDVQTIDRLRGWAEENAGATLRPTGIRMRNLNPIITTAELESAWWGYLVGGAPARFQSINTRSERLAEGKQSPTRALVPATSWFEKAGTWYRFEAGDRALLMMGAVTRPGRTADGQTHTCYSIVMQPAAPHLEPVHDRMPVLIPPGFVDEWLTSTEAPRDLLAAAVAASDDFAGQITARQQETSPLAS